MADELFSALGFVQFEIIPSDCRANLEQVEAGLSRLAAPAGSLILLPEVWSTGFVYEQLAVLAAETPKILTRLTELAAAQGLTLAGSLVEQEADPAETSLYNTLFFVNGHGICGKIRKQRLFAFWQEDQWLRPGDSPEVVETGCGLVAGLICYDLRFPELAREQCRQAADVLAVSAQWPLARLAQWRILQQARAIENQIHLVSCNGCGPCGDLELAGHSLLVAPDGTILHEAGAGPEEVVLPVDWRRQHQLRQRFNTVAQDPGHGSSGQKLLSLDECQRQTARRQRLGQRIVFTNGCFDILHAGHVHYLERARHEGDYLILGLNSDASIRGLKGPGRPVNNQQDRARVLAGLACVDALVIFDESTPLELITTLRPQVLVKGADWSEEQIVGAAEVKALGGRVVRIDFAHDLSTTALIGRIKGA